MNRTVVSSSFVITKDEEHAPPALLNDPYHENQFCISLKKSFIFVNLLTLLKRLRKFGVSMR